MFLEMQDKIYVDMDIVLLVVDKITLLICALAIFSNVATFVTLGRLPLVTFHGPVRLLQILAVHQAIWGTLHGVEDSRLRSLDSFVPDLVPRSVACKASISIVN